MTTISASSFEIPLDAQPQTFSINLGGITYQLTFTFNPVISTWILDIADFAGNPIIGGIAVVTGTDLLAQYGYLDFPGALVVWWVAAGQPQAPGFDNLGTDARLYFIPNAS